MTMIHLSVPISDIDASIRFYQDQLGCRVTRQQPDRLDIDFFGHHLVCQLSPLESSHQSVRIGSDPSYPLRHFGVIVEPEHYERLIKSLTEAEAKFATPPARIFVGTPREQSVFIVYDPSGNALEVKGLTKPEGVFA